MNQIERSYYCIISKHIPSGEMFLESRSRSMTGALSAAEFFKQKLRLESDLHNWGFYVRVITNLYEDDIDAMQGIIAQLYLKDGLK